MTEPLAVQIVRRLGVRPRRGAVAALTGITLATGSCLSIDAQQPILATARIPLPAQSAPVTLQLAAATTGEDPLALPPELRGLDFDAPPSLTGASAFQANAALPLVAQLGPAAAPLTLAGSDAGAHLRAQDCMAQNIYYEAGNQSEDGQRAVAQVVLNRVRHPLWPKSVCGVIFQGPMGNGGPRQCQFSWTCTGAALPAPRGAGWASAQRIARESLAGRVFAPVGLSTFYHANYVMPSWAPRLLKTAVIGAHIFYRLPGAGAGAFSGRYAGIEPAVVPGGVTRTASLAFAPGAGSHLEINSAPGAWTAAGESPVQAPPQAAAQPRRDDSQIRPEFAQSGQWREDAPDAITGR